MVIPYPWLLGKRKAILCYLRLFKKKEKRKVSSQQSRQSDRQPTKLSKSSCELTAAIRPPQGSLWSGSGSSLSFGGYVAAFAFAAPFPAKIFILGAVAHFPEAFKAELCLVAGLGTGFDDCFSPL